MIAFLAITVAFSRTSLLVRKKFLPLRLVSKKPDDKSVKKSRAYGCIK